MQEDHILRDKELIQETKESQYIVPASYLRYFSIFPNQIYIFEILALFSTNRLKVRILTNHPVKL
jgi:hypothetical protein